VTVSADVPLKVKVDEDLPPIAAHFLRQFGYDASTVVDQGMGGWKDLALWQAIQAEQRFLVTADKGFGNIKLYPPGTHSGILLLRPDEDGIRPVLELLHPVLAKFLLEHLTRTLAVATPRGVRVRR
jgi:predicted nuclease of predicted toxin-antitoxin system